MATTPPRGAATAYTVPDDDALTQLASGELPAQPVAVHDKLGAHDWFESIGAPKFVVAPMVDQSELAWRILSRVYGANNCYTPMFHAKQFGSATNQGYQQIMFDMSPNSIEGVAPFDRPLVVQFCANDKDEWLAAAEKVVGRCDAVDLNLGCPQGIAKKGHYGAFLMEDWALIKEMISHVHTNLAIPVIAKLRVYPSLEKTLAYATHVFSAGAQLVTVHGRVREAKGRLAGLADWTKIGEVVKRINGKVPVYANGGMPSAQELEPCLAETGANGLMSAEGNLYNPLLFNPLNAAEGRAYRKVLPAEMKAALDECDQLLGEGSEWKDNVAYAPSTFLASQYLAIVRTIPSTKTGPSAIKAHLFKLFRPTWAAGHHLDLREMLGRCGGGPKSNKFEEFVEAMHNRHLADLASGVAPAGSFKPLSHADVVANFGGAIPYTHAQPYLRVAAIATDEAQDPAALLADAPEALAKRTHGEISTATDLFSISPVPVSPSAAQPMKRLRIDEKTGAPVDVLSHCAGEGCVNGASAKCPHGACKACCGTSKLSAVEGRKEGADSVMCEFHAERARKEQERRDEKAAQRKAKQANKGPSGQPKKAQQKENVLEVQEVAAE